MNREIKFRGKDENGKWQYGSYYVGVLYPTSFVGHYINDERIDENTVGQFTGSENFYEADILGIHRVGLPDEPIGFVKYSSELCAFIINNFNGGWEYLHKELDYVPTIKVIGNLHENYELT